MGVVGEIKEGFFTKTGLYIEALTSSFVKIDLFKPVVLKREAVRYVVVIFESRIEGALKRILEDGLVLGILFTNFLFSLLRVGSFQVLYNRSGVKTSRSLSRLFSS